MEIVHRSVMAQEALEWLRPERDQSLLIDCTLGEGGHSALFLESYPSLRICGIDADAGIMAKAKERLSPFGERMQYFNGWYNDFFAEYPLEQRPDRVLFDFGISIYHYVESGRGFSFSRDEPLDMRLSPRADKPLHELLMSMDEASIAKVLFTFGEERYGNRIARAIVAAQAQGPLGSSKALAELIYHAVPADYRHGRIHPATRSFQAFRIMVNKELDRITEALEGAFGVMEPGGIMGVITFHSLEDRLVKQYFRDVSRDCHCPPEQPRCTCGRKPWAQLLVKKPVLPSPQECSENPPSRSAKFRFLKKLREKQ